MSASPLSLSAIIPAWCEAQRIEQAVRACRAVADEVIVSDAGSTDGTAALAQGAGARVVQAGRKGRGPQLNAGARAAAGDVLLFVHADTCLPPRARGAIVAALSEPRIVGGNFRLRFIPGSLASSLFASGYHLCRKHLGIYYGDSCVFVRRAVFEGLGGFKDLPIMEDYEFVRRLEQRGTTHYETAVIAESSARRFWGRPLRALAVWGLVQGLYSAGLSPDRLAALYADIR
jgi:rSAM/selenodomain-associated transferase 2